MRLDQSIIEINQLYSTFFEVIGVQESLGLTPVTDKAGKFGESDFKYKLLDGLGVVGVGKDMLQLDTAMCALAGFKLEEPSYLEKANGVLGVFDENIYAEAAADAGLWRVKV